MKTYAEHVYEIVKTKTKGMDAVYEHYILELVGESGLSTLIANHMIETCGTVNGNQLYVLCEKN